MKILHRSVTKLQIFSGFSKALLDTFKLKVSVMADQLKLCCVLLDELAIKENGSNNPEYDEVEDFGDAGKL